MIGEERGIKRGLEQGLEKGLEQGLEKGIEQVAKAMLSKNSDIAFIVDITGLSSVAVQKLQSSEELK